MNAIEVRNLSEEHILKDINIDIKNGEFVAILGANGSGKSTLVKHFNALLNEHEGKIKVFGIDTIDEKNIWEIRRRCGMVFQNPDNQFVSSVVEEDIAFGLENYNISRDKMPYYIEETLKNVGMEGYERRLIHSLSGGQKQRVALAGILAMEPDIIVFDEATSMLDAKGREEVLFYLRKLHENGKTIIMITHYVEEVVDVDRILLISNGRIIGEGSPRDVLSNQSLMAEARIIPPMPVCAYYDLLESGIRLSKCPLTNEELVEEICSYKKYIAV